MFAIEAIFDQETEKRILEFWTELKRADLDDSMIRIPGNRPHISLGLFQGVERAVFSDAFGAFRKTVEPISIQFDSVAVFPTSNTVFLSPLPSKELLQMHDDLYAALNDFASMGDDYYKKEQWMPHCSVAISVSDDALLGVVQKILQGFEPIKGRIERIALIEVFIDDKGIHHVEEVSLSDD